MVTLQEFYEQHKDKILAIYQGGSKCFGIPSEHDEDYNIFVRSEADRDELLPYLLSFRAEHKEVGEKADLFPHIVGEEFKIYYWSYQPQFWKLVHGADVEGRWDILQHKREMLPLTKRLARHPDDSKIWYHVYILAKVLSTDAFELTEQDKKIICDIYQNGITAEYKTLINGMLERVVLPDAEGEGGAE